jgi:hypothetical protein
MFTLVRLCMILSGSRHGSTNNGYMHARAVKASGWCLSMLRRTPESVHYVRYRIGGKFHMTRVYIALHCVATTPLGLKTLHGIKIIELYTTLYSLDAHSSCKSLLEPTVILKSLYTTRPPL